MKLLRLSLGVALLLTSLAPTVAQRGPTASPGGARVETLSDEGTVWTAATWGYTSPKLLWDGQRAYAVNLVGEGPGKDVARVMWRDTNGWHAGADLEPVYQPATLLLDEAGHIHVFCTDRGQHGHHWISTQPGDVTRFEKQELPFSRKFAYGYLGVGRQGSTLALAGLDRSYHMWVMVKPGRAEPWKKPVLVERAESRTPPVKAPLYPVVIPHGDEVDVVYSYCPDGSVHNTYNRVDLFRCNWRTGRVLRHERVAEGPIGEVTYGLDALLGRDGTLYSLYMTGAYRYGDQRPDRAERQGLYCAVLRPGGVWERRRVSRTTGTGQLWEGPDGRIHAFESTSTHTRHFHSPDQGRTWEEQAPAWDAPGFFLYVLKGNSGSPPDPTLRAVMSRIQTDVPKGMPGKYGLRYVESTLGTARMPAAK